MELDDKKIKRQQLASKVASVIKDLKRIRSQVALIEMNDHTRGLDLSMNELLKVKKGLLKDE